MTRPLEAACTSLRAELNTVHRRLIAHLEGRDLPLRLRDGPSKKVSSAPMTNQYNTLTKINIIFPPS